jgi:peptidoglycan/xylan/chitin deacetylase (PgdA/CDA1 family)
MKNKILVTSFSAVVLISIMFGINAIISPSPRKLQQPSTTEIGFNISIIPQVTFAGAILNTQLPTPFPVATAKPNVKFPVFLYHYIAVKIPKGKESIMITPSQFESDLKYLNAKGYHSITIKQLYDFLVNKSPLPKNPYMITFDDGYLNNYTFAYPLLKKYKINAVFFPIINSMGKSMLWSYFSWAQAKQMQNSGLIEIQNHTTKHQVYTSLSLSNAKADILKAQSEIEQHLGKISIKAFSYPIYRYNKTLLKEIKSLGFGIQFTGTGIMVSKSTPAYNINRIVINSRIRVWQTIKASS